MNTLKALAFASFMALGLSACGGDSGGEWKSKYQKIVDEACACKDVACFDAAKDKRRDLRKEFREAFKDKKDEAKKVGEKMEPLDKQFNECRDKLQAAAPPAEAAPAAPATKAPAAPATEAPAQ